MTLIAIKDGTRLVPDDPKDKSIVVNCNRWFRDGFADYTGYLALEAIISDDGFDQNRVFRAMLFNCTRRNPFSALRKIRND